MSAHKKVSARELPQSLTDEPEVLSAMKAIQRAGFWATLSGCVLALYCILLVFQAEIHWIAITVFGLLAAYFIWSGHRLNQLKGGDSLTIILIINMLTGGIISFQSILSLVALVKINHYQEWRKHGERRPFIRMKNVRKVVCDVTILDPSKGEHVEERTIDGAIYAKYAAVNGNIYAVRTHEGDKLRTSIVSESAYETAYEQYKRLID